jgi:phenylpropionate dioxygenase-like ring-hydroxylating dioxygenase large terminal subunit
MSISISTINSGNRPAEREEVLPGGRYVSREFMQSEWDNVWTKTWLITCRAEDLPESGDFLVEDIGRESILVVRQEDATIKAFYNVCQHRGNRLVQCSEGSVPQFTCAYHSWRYALDGTCQYVQDPEDFAGGNPCARAHLVETRCELFAGFVWINMDANCVPLRDYLGKIWDEWQVYPLEQRMVRVQAMSIRMPCNWKLILDNFHETYHLPTAHPQGIEYSEDSYLQTRIELFDNGHALGQSKCCIPSKRLPPQKSLLTDPIVAELRRWNLDPDSFKGREYETRIAVQQQKRQFGPARGHAHYERMTDDQLTDTFHYTVFPNFATSLNPDGMLFLRALPHVADPERCVFDCWYYTFGADNSFGTLLTSEGAAGKGPATREWINFGEKSLGVILDGDVYLIADQQRAVHSRGYRGALLAGQERRIAQYHDMIDRYIQGYRPLPTTKLSAA